MINITTIKYIIMAVLIVIIFVCTIGIVIASIFQNKKNKKYKECLKIINEKENNVFQVKDGLSKEEINVIDSEIDVDVLMTDLYNKYLELENKLKVCSTELDNILVGNLKDYFITKMQSLKLKNCFEIVDGIELISYSIIEFNKENLKFRIKISCFSYKMADNQIVSGSNLNRVEKVLLIDYQKVNKEWFICGYKNLYENKLSN